MGIVTQETVLFNETVAKNIAYGLDNYPIDLIEEVIEVINVPILKQTTVFKLYLYLSFKRRRGDDYCQKQRFFLQRKNGSGPQ